MNEAKQVWIQAKKEDDSGSNLPIIGPMNPENTEEYVKTLSGIDDHEFRISEEDPCMEHVLMETKMTSWLCQDDILPILSAIKNSDGKILNLAA